MDSHQMSSLTSGSLFRIALVSNSTHTATESHGATISADDTLWIGLCADRPMMDVPVHSAH